MLQLSSLLWAAFYAYWWYASRHVERTTETETDRSRLVNNGLMIVAYALALTPYIRLGFLDKRFLPDKSLVFWLGISLEMAGIALALWARLHLGAYWSGRVALKEGHQLIRSGPYAVVRNPIYTGLCLGMLGTAVALGEWRGVLAFGMLLVAVRLKIAVEEPYLAKQFGSEYNQYRRDVKALIPFLV